MSPEEIHATGHVDDQGRPIIDPSRGMKTVEQGAATTIWCATSSQLDGKGGVYCENCDIASRPCPQTLPSRPASGRGLPIQSLRSGFGR